VIGPLPLYIDRQTDSFERLSEGVEGQSRPPYSGWKIWRFVGGQSIMRQYCNKTKAI